MSRTIADSPAPELRLPADLAERPVDWEAVFGRHGAVEIEIGLGKGRFLLAAAERRPDVLHFGVEWANRYLRIAEARAARAGLENVRFVRADAVEVVRAIPDGSVDAYYVFYPDPWPKKRHHKRRIVQPAFVQLVRRKLKPGGIFHMATDWAPYAEHMLAVMRDVPGFCNLAADDFVERPQERPRTRFEARGQRLGHGVWDLMFERVD